MTFIYEIWCVLGNHGLRWNVNFDSSAKSSSTGYNESNKPNPKSSAHIGSEKSLVELGSFTKWAFEKMEVKDLIPNAWNDMRFSDSGSIS